MKENRFYVYVLLDPRKQGNYSYGNYRFDYEPFYVGRGTGYRYRKHFTQSGLNDDTFRCRVIKKLFSENLEPILIKIHEDISYEESGQLEKELISIIGRRNRKTGPLTNIR